MRAPLARNDGKIHFRIPAARRAAPVRSGAALSTIVRVDKEAEVNA